MDLTVTEVSEVPAGFPKSVLPCGIDIVGAYITLRNISLDEALDKLMCMARAASSGEVRSSCQVASRH